VRETFCNSFLTVQEHFIAYCKHSKDAKVFKFLFSSYSLIRTWNSEHNCIFLIVQEHFKVYCRFKEAVKLFWFLLSLFSTEMKSHKNVCNFYGVMVSCSLRTTGINCSIGTIIGLVCLKIIQVSGSHTTKNGMITTQIYLIASPIQLHPKMIKRTLIKLHYSNPL
jgi:hypothetical protein